MTAFEINDVEFRRVLPSTRIDEFIQKANITQKIKYYNTKLLQCCITCEPTI